MAELTCPDCKGTRIGQTMQATVDYVVEYDEAGHVEIVEPADVVHGHTQYEIMGAWDDSLFCLAKDCTFESTDVFDFLPDEED